VGYLRTVVAALAAMPVALLAFMVAQSGGISDLSLVRMLGVIGFLLVILITSISLMRQPGAGSAPGPAAS
jgi:hypothetical protein